MRIYPVILCGGAGTRLWPASRPAHPKQFVRLLGERSLFQETVLRLQGLAGAAVPVVVGGAAHVGAIRRQLAEIGSEGIIIAEPEGRDSAPAIAAAAAWIAAHDPEGVAVAVASDHHIPDPAAFREAVLIAAAAAADGWIVTFGVQPSAPATAYGYIQPGAALAGFAGVQALARFVEKPDAATAADYVASGYLWNSGNFVFSATVLLDELARHAPEVSEAAIAAVAAAGPGATLMLGERFRTAPKVSIDYSLMEKTDRAAVAPVAFGWSDLGAWDAIHAASGLDDDGNATSGQAILVNTRDSLIRSDGPVVIAVGLERIAVVAEAGAVLVCALDASQSVKQGVDRLKALTPSAPEAASPDQAPADLGARLSLWLRGSALPLWWTLGANHEGGGFHELVGQDALPVRSTRRFRVQARQVYSYAAAAGLGWAGPWREALEHGLTEMTGRYRRSDGLFRTLVSYEGEPLDDTAMLYDQAFAILALAAAATAQPERAADLESIAAEVAGVLRRDRTAGPGFVEAAGLTPFQSNPHMHLFEAALAWEAVSGAAEWRALADALAQLALDRFVDGPRGLLREYFDADWAPAAGEAGRIVEPGHQFEWSWLLQRWARARGRREAFEVAQRLFETGRLGVDHGRGVAVDSLWDDLTPREPSARLWPQTERLKASLAFGAQAEAVAAGHSIWAYLQTPVPGLWRDQMAADGRFDTGPARASTFYHLVGAIVAMSTEPTDGSWATSSRSASAAAGSAKAP